MKRKHIDLLKAWLLCTDLAIINIIFLLLETAFRSRQLINRGEEYGYLVLMLNVLWIILTYLHDAYEGSSLLQFDKLLRKTSEVFVSFVLLTSFFLFIFRMIELSRVFIAATFAAIAIVMLISRIFYIFVFRHLGKIMRSSNKIIIIGYNELSKSLVQHLNVRGSNNQVVGFCEEYDNIKELSTYPILGNISETIANCKSYGVNEIYSTISPKDPMIPGLIRSANQHCIRFRVIPDIGVAFTPNLQLDYIGGHPIITIHKEPLEDPGKRLQKRLFDLVVSSLVIIFILSWLIPIIGLLVKLNSKGSIFFSQERTGQNNRKFRCLKFRSMHMNTQADQLQATRNDSRVTLIGRFLRTTSIDELPQFLNVWMGDMSVVGPRPHMLKHTDEYSISINQYMVRQFSKPGITGWAQVNGLRGETQTLLRMQQRVEHDIWYMENWSLILDMKIMWMTVLCCFRRNEAY